MTTSQIFRIDLTCTDKINENTISLVKDEETDRIHPEIKLPATPKILLVEDTVQLQRINKHLLESMQCDVDLANTGQEAISLVSEDYDVVLLDIGLPDISGIDVCQQLRQSDAAYKNIPIIAVTADDEAKETCLAVGMNDFCLKPLTKEIVQYILDKWVFKKIKSVMT